MTNSNDERWLKAIIEDCFCDTHSEDTNDRRLTGFGTLLREMVKNIERNLEETRILWEANPASKELEEKFNLLAKDLFYINRFCREKIEGGENG